VHRHRLRAVHMHRLGDTPVRHRPVGPRVRRGSLVSHGRLAPAAGASGTVLRAGDPAVARRATTRRRQRRDHRLCTRPRPRARTVATRTRADADACGHRVRIRAPGSPTQEQLATDPGSAAVGTDASTDAPDRRPPRRAAEGDTDRVPRSLPGGRATPRKRCTRLSRQTYCGSNRSS
jgi:hypothetical protein